MIQTLTRAAALSALLLATAVSAAPPREGSGVAWDITEGLTTEIGQRLAGSDREAAARDWGWVRGPESASLTAPYPHKLAVTALGYSAPTPAGGIAAPLVYFPTLDALKAAPAGSLAGKIAFIDHAFRAAQDGSGYGPFGAARRQGPAIASSKGAVGVVIRSIGTDWQRNPHTGGTGWAKGVTPIPAGAVSNPDADLIARIAKRGKPMTLALQLEGRAVPQMPSGNVIAELPGRDPSLPPILVACHLDSWDLGTGAFDDAAGCGIVTEAALAAQKGGKPLRTIRVLTRSGACSSILDRPMPHWLTGSRPTWRRWGLSALRARLRVAQTSARLSLPRNWLWLISTRTVPATLICTTRPMIRSTRSTQTSWRRPLKPGGGCWRLLPTRAGPWLAARRGATLARTLVRILDL
jgi:hypothetical protein